MTGYEFAKRLNEYLKEQGHSVCDIGKIESNPDRSKHLETATTKIFGVEIDFVNLRNEVYAKNSRTPTEIVSYSIECNDMRCAI